MLKVTLEQRGKKDDTWLASLDNIYWYPIQIIEDIISFVGVIPRVTKEELHKIKRFGLEEKEMLITTEEINETNFLFISIGPVGSDLIEIIRIFNYWPFKISKGNIIYYVNEKALPKDRDSNLMTKFSEIGWNLKIQVEFPWISEEPIDRNTGFNILKQIISVLSPKDKILKSAIDYGFSSEWIYVKDAKEKDKLLKEINIDEKGFDDSVSSRIANLIEKNDNIFRTLYILSKNVHSESSFQIINNLFGRVPWKTKKNIIHETFPPKLVLNEVEIHIKLNVPEDMVEEIKGIIAEYCGTCFYVRSYYGTKVGAPNYRFVLIFEEEVDYTFLPKLFKIIDGDIDTIIENIENKIGKQIIIFQDEMWLKRLGISFKMPCQLEEDVICAFGGVWLMKQNSMVLGENFLTLNADVLYDIPLYSKRPDGEKIFMPAEKIMKDIGKGFIRLNKKFVSKG